jgi:hypothetical protein
LYEQDNSLYGDDQSLPLPTQLTGTACIPQVALGYFNRVYAAEIMLERFTKYGATTNMFVVS